MKKRRPWIPILAGALVLFTALQFCNPALTNPPPKREFLTATPPPPAVAAALQTACYDCHSAQTRWPWYARIAPVSWLIASDVNEGREHMNFSDWPAEPDRAAKKLERINEVLDYREMPPKKYTLIHANARLTDVQRKAIMDWTETAAQKLRAASTNS